MIAKLLTLTLVLTSLVVVILGPDDLRRAHFRCVDRDDRGLEQRHNARP